MGLNTRVQMLFFALIVLTITLGVIDWATGIELNFFVFYFIPVSIAGWYLGLGPAVALSMLSALVWFVANDLPEHTASANFYSVWNTGIRLTSFLCIGFAISKMRRLLEMEKTSAADLRQALSEIRLLEGVLPICAQCKKIRNSENTWQQLEAYISHHSDTRFSHSYCPECARCFMEEAGLMAKNPGKVEN